MMGYGDRTWCTANTCRYFGKGCSRSLTDEVKSRAEDWWGDENYPIAVFVGTPSCFEEEKNGG